MKYLIVILTSLVSLTALAQSGSDSVSHVEKDIYSMIVVNRYYGSKDTQGSIQIYYPDMVAPILWKNNSTISFNVNLLNALNKHAEEGWSLVNVEVHDSKLESFSADPGIATTTTVAKDETIYLFKKAR